MRLVLWQDLFEIGFGSPPVAWSIILFLINSYTNYIKPSTIQRPLSFWNLRYENIKRKSLNKSNKSFSYLMLFIYIYGCHYLLWTSSLSNPFILVHSVIVQSRQSFVSCLSIFRIRFSNLVLVGKYLGNLTGFSLIL